MKNLSGARSGTIFCRLMWGCLMWGWLAIGASACTIVDDTDPAADPYATESAFCQALAAAACNADVVTACYLSTDEQVAEDTKKCVTARSETSRCNPLGLNYDSAGAAACIAAVKVAYGDAKLTADEVAASSQACLAVFSVGGEVGTSCEADVDCDGAAGLQCVVKAGKGSCQTPEEVGPGLKCAADNAVCEVGFYCGSDEACVERPGPAEACAADKPCVETALCIDDVCAAKTANGASCTTDGECAGGFCVMAKDQTTGTCGSQLILSSTTANSCEPFLP
jgi:hypothetical protein